MTRLIPFVALALLGACTLLTNFDPDGQPCDYDGSCLPGYGCVAGQCRKGADGGTGGQGGGGGLGGGAGGGGGGSSGPCVPACASDQACVNGRCLPLTCAASTCATGAVCVGTSCVAKACVDVACDGGVCSAGQCVPTACGLGRCTGGKACRNGTCVDVSCTGLSCPAAQGCVRGACTACLAREVDCANGSDDDCDGLVDCADPDCATRTCDDGNGCTTGEVCSNSACSGGTVTLCNSPGPCQTAPGTCDPPTGQCVYQPRADGASCGTPPSQRCCSGVCVDITSSLGNCGGCGLACAPGQQCLTVAQATCVGAPAATTGRCTCSTGAACPAAQACGGMAGFSTWCSPSSANQCAAGEVRDQVPVSCPAYCRY